MKMDLSSKSNISTQEVARAVRIISDFSRLNYLACSVINALSGNDFLSDEWLYEKAEWLNGKDKFDVLLWVSNLGYDNMKLVANELNVSIENLQITLKTLSSI